MLRLWPLALVLAARSAGIVAGDCSASTFPACLPPSSTDMPGYNPWPTQADIDDFAARVQGSVAQPGESGYMLFTFNARTHVPRPAIVFSPANVADVQAAVIFARDHGMRLSVSSTGHHQDVRNVADNSFHLDMHALSSIEIDVPNKLATVGTGAVFGSIARAAGAASATTTTPLVVASGSDSSVGPYGWTVGGGYGRLTRTHGLGVDLVRSFDIVLANGSLVTASAESNPDLFWAMRGSGGHAFGVTTSMTLQLVDDPGQTNSYVLTADLSTANAGMFEDWAASAPDYAGAFFVSSVTKEASSSSSAAASANATNLPVTPLIIAAYCFGSTSDCDAILAPLISSIECPPALGANCSAVLRYPTYLDFQLDQPTFHGDGSAIAISSAALNTDTVLGGGLQNLTAWVLEFEALYGSFEGIVGSGCFCNLVLGGASATLDTDNAATSVSPAMRESIVQITCHVDWDPASTMAASILDKFEAWARSNLQPLSSRGWVYWNEPQHNLKDWQHRYWTASTYARLLRVKNEVDPNGFFVCYHCVGAEQINDAAVCPSTSCRCSNVAVGECSVDPSLSDDCVDAPVFSALVAGPEWYDDVLAWIGAGELSEWANCTTLANLMVTQLTVDAQGGQDICTTIPSFASACPAYCGECGNIADEVTFAVVAIVIIVSAALCGIGFAIFAAKTRERRLAASETGVKERLQPGGSQRRIVTTDGYRRRANSSVVDDYTVSTSMADVSVEI